MASNWHHKVGVFHAQWIQQGRLHERLQRFSAHLLAHSTQKVCTEAVGVTRTSQGNRVIVVNHRLKMTPAL